MNLETFPLNQFFNESVYIWLQAHVRFGTIRSCALIGRAPLSLVLSVTFAYLLFCGFYCF